MLDYLIPLWLYPILFWTLFWKGVSGWKAARRGHLSWFIVFLFFNTFGILPIFYYFFLDKIKFYNIDDKKTIKRNIRVKSSHDKKLVKKNKIPTLD